MIDQVTLFLENRKGRLAKALNVIADADINLYSFTVAETDDYGIARIIVNKPEAAVEVLRESNHRAHLTPMIVVKIENKVGASVNLLDALEANNINIEYCYAFSSSDNVSYIVLRTVSPGAEEFIEYLGYETISKEDFYN